MCLAIPGRVLQLSGADPLERIAKVDFSGALREISVACTPDVAVGDYVLVHAGLCLAIIDQQEAEYLLASLEAIDYQEEQS